jgi:hypothetical protein
MSDGITDAFRNVSRTLNKIEKSCENCKHHDKIGCTHTKRDTCIVRDKNEILYNYHEYKL